MPDDPEDAAELRPPARQREGGWGRREWLAWQDRMFPDLPLPTQREPLVMEICAIRQAMYYKMNGGSQFPSERVQRRCELAEISSAVAQGKVTPELRDRAERLLLDREFQFVIAAYHVSRNWVTPPVKEQAAKAVLWVPGARKNQALRESILREYMMDSEGDPVDLDDPDEEETEQDRDRRLRSRALSKKGSEPIWKQEANAG